MCKICKTRFDIHEKIAAHDYYEQLCDFYGLTVKEPKKYRLTKRSLLSQIENELMRLQTESNQKQLAELQQLQGQESADLVLKNKQFQTIMQEYYETKLRE
jgi:hypothetical protein